MGVSDTAIRKAMTKSVNALIARINSHELPMAQTENETIAVNGDWTDPLMGDKRYWLACIFVTSRHDEIERLKEMLRSSFGRNQSCFSLGYILGG